MRRPVWVNYLYFGSLFFLLLTLSIGHLFLRQELGHERLFFLFSSLGQAILETLLFVIVGWYVEHFFPRLFFLFIILTFSAFLFHFFDFAAEKAMDVSFAQVIKAYVLDESLDNFFFLLDAAGFSLWVWAIFFGALFITPLFGIAIYKMTSWIVGKRPLYMRWEFLLYPLFCTPVALFLWDVYASSLIESGAHAMLRKALPWKKTFYHPRNYYLTLPAPLHLPETAEVMGARLMAASVLTLAEKPNLYLFVVESLRDDHISPVLTPALNRFREEGISFAYPISNGNGTHLSWFSALHADDAVHWKKTHEVRGGYGALPLHLLKKMGYSIRLYAAAQFGYYKMDELLFGANSHLLSHIGFFPHAPPGEAWESDAQAVAALIDDLKNPALQKGQCCLVFLDSTHFTYSFPAEMGENRGPGNYLETLKSRYRSAFHYIDDLFGKFLENLPNPNGARIAFTGDHGEEFNDEGRLFHASHLSKAQTRVPLYFRLPQKGVATPIASHMDIFPTFFHSLTGSDANYGLWKGSSILSQSHPQVVFTSRYNAGSTPAEFAIQSPKAKMVGRFAKSREVYEAPVVQLLSLQKGGQVPQEKKAMEAIINQEFGDVFERLFENN